MKQNEDAVPSIPDDVWRDALRYRFVRVADKVPISHEAARDPVAYDEAIDRAMRERGCGSLPAPKETHPDAGPTPGELLEWGSQAVLDVAAERRRQVDAKGWTPEHDDEHVAGELATAGASYALVAVGYGLLALRTWPWPAGLKPTTPRRDLVKAGALILAEIERLDRMAERQEGA